MYSRSASHKTRFSLKKIKHSHETNPDYYINELCKKHSANRNGYVYMRYAASPKMYDYLFVILAQFYVSGFFF